eukprot:PhF_6_TR6025/c0_g1_i2/m.8682
MVSYDVLEPDGIPVPQMGAVNFWCGQRWVRYANMSGEEGGTCGGGKASFSAIASHLYSPLSGYLYIIELGGCRVKYIKPTYNTVHAFLGDFFTQDCLKTVNGPLSTTARVQSLFPVVFGKGDYSIMLLGEYVSRGAHVQQVDLPLSTMTTFASGGNTLLSYPNRTNCNRMNIALNPVTSLYRNGKVVLIADNVAEILRTSLLHDIVFNVPFPNGTKLTALTMLRTMYFFANVLGCVYKVYPVSFQSSVLLGDCGSTLVIGSPVSLAMDCARRKLYMGAYNDSVVSSYDVATKVFTKNFVGIANNPSSWGVSVADNAVASSFGLGKNVRGVTVVGDVLFIGALRDDWLYVTGLAPSTSMNQYCLWTETKTKTTKPPPTTLPPSTQPASTQPASTQPASTQPASTQPASTQPASTQ